jgi:hypothetical protein
MRSASCPMILRRPMTSPIPPAANRPIPLVAGLRATRRERPSDLCEPGPTSECSCHLQEKRIAADSD